MKNFITDYINTALFIHLISSLLIILFIRLIINSSIKFNSDSLTLNNDEYFILNNEYDIKKIFYYITYKLYNNNILTLKMSEGKFYYKDNTKYSLNHLEKEVCMLYVNGLSPKEFTAKMIDQYVFKQYFNSIYENLIQNKFIKSKKKILISNIMFFIGLLIILIPTIVLLTCSHGLFISQISINSLIVVFFYVLLLKDMILSNLTLSGIKAIEIFKEKSSYHSKKLTNNNYSNDMDKFLLQNIYEYYFDDIDDYDSDGFDGIDE